MQLAQDRNDTETRFDSMPSEEQLRLLQTITMEVSAAADLPSALDIVLRRVCEKTSWTVGQAWLPSPDGTVLRLGPGCYRGDGELKDFKAFSQSLQFQIGIGLPGRVWQTREPLWVEDVTNDPNFPRAPAALTAGLRTGVAIPIVS